MICVEQIAEIIAPKLAHLVVEHLSEETYSEIVKDTKFIPMYKGKRIKEVIRNYSPIALLPVLGKLMKKLTKKKIFKLYKNNGRFEEQSLAFTKSEIHKLQLWM